MRRHTLLYGFLLFLALTVLLRLAFGGYPQSTSGAYAQGTSAIAGKVTGDGGTPVADVVVVVYQLVDFMNVFYWEGIGQGLTDANGDYLVADLADGTYRVGFLPPDNPREYFAQYYLGATTVESATDVIVPAGTTVQNISAQLPSGAHIKGRVTGPSSEDLAGINVYINGLTVSFQRSVTPNATGRYDIGGMEAGTYNITFRDPQEPPQFAMEHFDNRDREEAPSPITLTTNQIRTGINAQLDRLGVIRGQVTDMAGAPLANITVVGQRYSAEPPDPDWDDDAYGYTDATGIYTMTGLYADTWRVLFRDNNYGRYSFEWYDDTYDANAATVLPVTLNSTTSNINAQLAVRGPLPAS